MPLFLVLLLVFLFFESWFFCIKLSP
jgi:hypothetical protein